jgi:hypothetical protein
LYILEKQILSKNSVGKKKKDADNSDWNYNCFTDNGGRFVRPFVVLPHADAAYAGRTLLFGEQ